MKTMTETPQDHKQPKPTKTELLIYELATNLEAMKANYNSLHRILTAVIASQDMDMELLVKTVRNDVRIKSTLELMHKTELQIMADEGIIKTDKADATSAQSHL